MSFIRFVFSTSIHTWQNQAFPRLCMAFRPIFPIVCVPFFQHVYKQKSNESNYVLMVMFCFALYGVLLGMVLRFEVNIEMPSLLLFLIMVLSLALLMSYRSQQAYEKVENMSNELLEFDRMKDEFLVKTSHELGTPLHRIINLSQSLLEGVDGPLRLKRSLTSR